MDDNEEPIVGSDYSAEDEELDIPDELRDKVQDAVIDWAEEHIAGFSERNEKFRRNELQLKGNPTWHGIMLRWPGSSMVESQMTREHHIEVVAEIMAVLSHDKWWAATAKSQEDIDAASAVEDWMNSLIGQYNLVSEVGYPVVYDAAKNGCAWVYCGWEEVPGKIKGPSIMKDPETGEEVAPEDLDPTVDYDEEVSYVDIVDSEGYCFSVYPGEDVYPYPPNVTKGSQAQRIVVCDYVTQEELIAGIKDYGYDRDAVLNIIKANVDGRSEARVEKDEEDGVNGGLIRIVKVFGTPPVTTDGDDLLLDDKFYTQKYFWVYEPHSRETLKFSPCMYDCMPFARYGFLDDPGRGIGCSVNDLVGGLHIEDTVAQRFRIDLRDVTLSSPLLVPDDMYEFMRGVKIQPGAMIPYKRSSGVGGTAPLPFNPGGFQAAMADSQDLNGRAERIFSSAAKGTSTGSRRSATEVEIAAGGADSKFDLFIGGIRRGNDQLMNIMMSHLLQFKPSDEMQQLSDAGVTITSVSDFNKKYLIQSVGSSEDANPQAAMQEAMGMFQFLMQNPIIQQQIQQGNLSAVYDVTERVLRKMGEKNPKSILGPKPGSGIQPAQILQVLTQLIVQGVQQGDQTCVAILQQLEQITQQMSMGQTPPNMVTAQPPNQQGDAQNGMGMAQSPQAGQQAGM